jgi:SAM-dependent methyltransferase
MSTYNPHGDLCLSIFSDVYATGALVFPPNARVLEIGCAEADWQTPMLAIRPDLQITGIDWRKCRRPGTTIQGDVLVQDFEPGSFDVVVGVSSIEHIGLGHYEADPKDETGDAFCMQRVARWLKPGGWAYLDVPFNARGYMVLNTEARIYDDEQLQHRLVDVAGLKRAGTWYATRAGAFLGTTRPEPRDLPHFDYVALLVTA